MALALQWHYREPVTWHVMTPGMQWVQEERAHRAVDLVWDAPHNTQLNVSRVGHLSYGWHACQQHRNAADLGSVLHY